MAKVLGLFDRDGRWYIRVMIPSDLLEAYPREDGKPRKSGKVVIALDTSDRKEAVVRGTIKRAEWLADFQQKYRERNLSPLEKVSGELAQQLAQMVRAFVLESDDALRADAALWADMARVTHSDYSALRIPQGVPENRPEDDLSGLDGVQLAELAAFNSYADGKAALAMAGRNLSAVLQLVQQQAKRLGLEFDPKVPGAREALQAALSEYRKAHREKVLRDAGEVVQTPSVTLLSSPVGAGPAKGRTLRDVFELWERSGEKPRTKDTITAMNRALKQFESQHPALPLESITRAMGHEYRAWLLTTDLASKTANDRLVAIKSLLKFASQELQWLPRQPWEGLAIEVTTENPRRPWSPTELQTLFSAPLHTAYSLPPDKNAGADAAYWIPLLGLFTGARLGELAQLQVQDVRELEGSPVLVITDTGKGQRVKSKAGKRTIPIHSELLRLGFVEYAQAVRERGEVSLWPALPLRNGKPSEYFGRWFFFHRQALGLAGATEAPDSEAADEPVQDTDYPTFHYFRHTVRPLMRRAGISSAVQDRITGHETRGSIGDEVYDHVMADELGAAVEAIRYPYLSLPRVFKG